MVGVLQDILPGGEEIIEVEETTVSGLLDDLVRKYGAVAAKEFKCREGLREGLSLLINGRNVLSLPDKFQTKLQDGDEVIITVRVSGG
jgi:molybdopterin converting factor small subunit